MSRFAAWIDRMGEPMSEGCLRTTSMMPRAFEMPTVVARTPK